jgi:hypothetical protein
MPAIRTIAPDIVITGPVESLFEKLRVSEILDRRDPSSPSLCDELIADRRRERQRELEEEGW